ncbi:YceI family protein [Aquimarina sp. SS2-1]|uniref:YceI family protein n=1 Tax=Aquimarina besae TaxID=3342247 RepID=UPI00366C00E7
MKFNVKNRLRMNSDSNNYILAIIYVITVILGCSEKTDYITTASGLQYKVIKEGSGPVVTSGQEVLIHETTKYPNDSLVYTSRNRENPLKILVGGNQVIKGVDEGLQGMKIGEIRKLIVPPSLSKRTGNVTFPHPDSTLLYDIELIDIVKKEKSSVPLGSKVLKIDKENSTLRWEGFNKLHTNGHYGIVEFDNGQFYEKNSKIVGGNFVIDMNSIRNTDGEYSESLVDHLKNADFFETEKYPFAELSITDIKYTANSGVNLTADLTIKKIKQPITFDAFIKKLEGKIIFESKFIIDRTRWNMFYQSGSFFGNVSDNLISDEIHFEVKITTQ